MVLDIVVFIFCLAILGIGVRFLRAPENKELYEKIGRLFKRIKLKAMPFLSPFAKKLPPVKIPKPKVKKPKPKLSLPSFKNCFFSLLIALNLLVFLAILGLLALGFYLYGTLGLLEKIITSPSWLPPLLEGWVEKLINLY